MIPLFFTDQMKVVTEIKSLSMRKPCKISLKVPKTSLKNIFSTKKILFYNMLYISTKYIQGSGKKLHK
jgi:hypothetical protein